MGSPYDAAVHACKTLADDGTVMPVEPFAADCVAENINSVGRLYYAATTTLCYATQFLKAVPMYSAHRLEKINTGGYLSLLVSRCSAALSRPHLSWSSKLGADVLQPER